MQFLMGQTHFHFFLSSPEKGWENIIKTKKKIKIKNINKFLKDQNDLGAGFCSSIWCGLSLDVFL